MKRQTMLVMFGVIAVSLATGIVAVSAFSPPMMIGAYSDTKAGGQLGIYGHITLTATDSQGKVISYIQTDNIIVNSGENCVAESLFNVTTTGTGSCAGDGTQTVPGGDNNGVADGGFTFIGIGDGGATAAVSNDLILANEILPRVKDSTPELTQSSGTSGTSAVVTLTGVFTAAADGLMINESGIFDEETDGNMLARKTFDDITLNTGDKLTVEWEITIGS